MQTPLRIGIIGYDGIQAPDLIGPSDAFTSVSIAEATGAEHRP